MMYGRHARLAAAAMAAWWFVSSTPSRAQEPSGGPPDVVAPAITYLITINGEEFEVVGGAATKVTSRKDGGAAYEVSARVKPIQTYATDRLSFDYAAEWTLSDDGDRVYREIYLYHPHGASMSITQQEPIADAEEQKEVLAMLVKDMLRSVRRGNNRDVTVTDPKPCANNHGSGFYSDVRCIDQEGDAGVERLIVMTSGSTSFSLNQSFYAEDEQVMTDLAKSIVDTIREKPNPPPAPGPAERPSGA